MFERRRISAIVRQFGTRVFESVPSQTDIGLKGSQLQVYAYQSDGERYVMSFVIERSIPQAQVEKGVVCAKPGRAFYATTRNICSLD